MAFTVNDLQDLIALLAAKPEWRAQLRPLILGDEFDRLPEIVERLAEAQERTEARVEELAEAQKRTEARVEQLAAALTALTARVDDLAVEMRSLANSFREFNEQYQDDSGALYEVRFERKVGSIFGRWLRRPRLVDITQLDALVEAEDAGRLSEDEMDALRELDILVVGGDKREPGYPETYFALEVSRTIDESDVDRADRRAAILNKAGLRAFPVVGGRFLSISGERMANERNVLVRLVNQV